MERLSWILRDQGRSLESNREVFKGGLGIGSICIWKESQKQEKETREWYNR
jgi:hypothetical protein